MLIFFASGLSTMVFEHLQNYFLPKNSMNGFPQLFWFSSHITQGHIPCWIAHILVATYLLAMTKPLSGIFPFVVKETMYWFTSHALCLQFYDTFVIHFSPHQFKIVTKGRYEGIIHGIKCTLDFHLLPPS
jgi:hypothetical protein